MPSVSPETVKTVRSLIASGRPRERGPASSGALAAGESWRLAARSVLRISMAMVMGPTPPGTGVMARTFGLTEAKSTSPRACRCRGGSPRRR